MKWFILALSFAGGLTSCHDDEVCLEALCSPLVTVTLTSPMSEGYDLAVKVHGHDLATRCPGSVTGESLVLDCDASGFKIGGRGLFREGGAPSHVNLVVSTTNTTGEKVADNVPLAAPVRGSSNGGCKQSCYRASATLNI